MTSDIPKPSSVKATIPKEIVEKVKISPGDVRDWDIMVEKKGGK